MENLVSEPDALSDAGQSIPPQTPSLNETTARTTDSEEAQARRRVERLWMVDPCLSQEEVEALIEESDRFEAALADAGVTDADLFLRHEIARVEVSEEELYEYYESQRERFGDRSFEESRSSLESLVRLRKVRETYGGAPEQEPPPSTTPGPGTDDRRDSQ